MPFPGIDEQSFFVDRIWQHLVPGKFPSHLGDVDVVLEFISFRYNCELDDPVRHGPHEVLLPFGKYPRINEQEECCSLAAG